MSHAFITKEQLCQSFWQLVKVFRFEAKKTEAALPLPLKASRVKWLLRSENRWLKTDWLINLRRRHSMKELRPSAAQVNWLLRVGHTEINWLLRIDRKNKLITGKLVSPCRASCICSILGSWRWITNSDLRLAEIYTVNCYSDLLAK